MSLIGQESRGIDYMIKGNLNNIPVSNRKIKMKYVYFYDKSQNERLYSLNPGLTDREIMVKLSVAQGLDTNMYLRPEEMKQIIDLSSEDNHVVRVLERENGRKVFLRMFRDMWIYPSEAEVTAAIRQLVDDDLPVVGFLTGHGVRNSEKAGDRDYRYFVQERVYRRALINQGFAIEKVDLDDDIPERVNILVIADMQTALSPEEMEFLEKYIARGGNLIIAGDVGRGACDESGHYISRRSIYDRTDCTTE